MNHVILMGRMVRGPELRHTQSGTPVATFALAVDRQFNKGKVDWIDCVAWRSTAEFVSKYFSKGKMCAVHGTLQNRDWTDKDGNKRRSAEVIVDSVYFCGDKGGSDYGGDSDFSELDDDGDLPFTQ